MTKKKKIFISIILIILVLLANASFAMYTIKNNSILTINKTEVVAGDSVELTIDISKIQNEKFKIILTSDLNESEISSKQNLELEKESNGEVTIEIDKTKTNLNNIKLEYVVPSEIEVGTEIKYNVKIIEEELSNNNPSEFEQNEIIDGNSVEQNYNQDKEQILKEETIKVKVIEKTEVKENQNSNKNDNSNNIQQPFEMTDTKNNETDKNSGTSGMQTSENSNSNKNVTNMASFSLKSTNESSKITYNGSNNNYLKSLEISGITLNTTFSKENTSYFATTTQNTDLIVTAVAEDGNAKVKVTGNTSIKEGINKILISVTAKNGEVRYYRIFVNYNVKSNTAKVSTSSQISSALEENTDLHTGYYLSEVYVEENQFVAKGENILKYSNGTYLTAPYDCYISELNLPDTGSQITTDNYVKIQSKNVLMTTFNVSEKNIANIDIGDKVTIKIKSLDKEYTGYVTYVSNTASNNKFEVKVEFINDGNIKLGMSANISIE